MSPCIFFCPPVHRTVDRVDRVDKPPLKDIIKRYYKKFGNKDESSEEQQDDDLVTAVTPSA